MPWTELRALIEPHYAKGEMDRKPVGYDIMLRVYFLQRWFELSDPGIEDALYESPVLRCFAGIDLGYAAAPDETTVLNFRHMLEGHELCGQMLDTVNHYLESKGIRITTGTILDATIIHAPSSTKNEKKERDPEMHQMRKDNQWYFALKAHIGVDSKEGIVHTLCSAAASVSDLHMLPDLLHGGEKKVWGDGGYQGQTEKIREAAREGQGGVPVSRHQARLRLYQGELSRLEEEPRVAVRRLRLGQSLSTPQATGTRWPEHVICGSVVCPPVAEQACGGQNVNENLCAEI